MVLEEEGPPLLVGVQDLGGVLVVWDFDWSMIEENSDTFVLRLLGTEELFRENQRSMPWTALMDHVFSAATSDTGLNRNPDDVFAACAQIPMAHGVPFAIRSLHARGATQCIISDANEVFIDMILEHLGLRDAIYEIHTNHAHFCATGKSRRLADGAPQPARSAAHVLRVQPYHGCMCGVQAQGEGDTTGTPASNCCACSPCCDGAPPADARGTAHDCDLCPANLCKGRVFQGVLHRWRAAKGGGARRVLYVGDGTGDLCPASMLGPEDYVLVRRNYPGQAPPAPLLRAIRANRRPVAAQVVEWEPQELGDLLLQHAR
ncbi:unnamed protein product [Pedinophyceae sp. YPF-701]|nr:unnamed protein product [Pedinophyceae sp. YPF-701]